MITNHTHQILPSTFFYAQRLNRKFDHEWGGQPRQHMTND